jgi:hypothetical protein
MTEESGAAVPDVSSPPEAKLGQAARITPRNSRIQKGSCPVGGQQDVRQALETLGDEGE